LKVIKFSFQIVNSLIYPLKTFIDIRVQIIWSFL